MVAHETTGSMERQAGTWTPKRIRQAGLVAIVSGAFGVVLSLLVTAAYHLTPDGMTESVAPWEPALRNLAEPLLTFAAPTAVYDTYGALAFFVFAGLLVGLLGARAHRRSAASGANAGRLERWGFRAAIAGLALNLLGNVGDYWLGRPEVVDFLGFLVGTLAGLLVLAVGLALLGIAALRTGAPSRVVAWSFLLWVPVTVVVSAVGLNNIPGGPLLPLSLVGIALGYHLRSATETPAEPSRADDETVQTG